VTLSIYNLLGQLVDGKTLENRAAGTHTAKWNGLDQNGEEVSSGIYFYQLKTEKFTETKKMVFLK